jgi:multidrug efflux pump subunit AcrA (membrane-fusion protein)
MHLSIGTVLLKLVDVSELYVDVEVLENEVGKIAVGRRAEIKANAYPGETFLGAVVAINPVVDPESKTVKVTIALLGGSGSRYSLHGSPSPAQSGPRLKPGMYVTARVETEVLTNRLVVPKASVLVRDQRTLVFVAREGLAKWHYVGLGESNEEVYEIVSGIAEGDTVIVDGHYTLAHEARIRIQ